MVLFSNPIKRMRCLHTVLNAQRGFPSSWTYRVTFVFPGSWASADMALLTVHADHVPSEAETVPVHASVTDSGVSVYLSWIAQ